MEDLLLQLSELLGMSVNNLVKYYPEIRSQYNTYLIIDSIRWMITLAIIILLAGFGLVPPIVGLLNENKSSEYTNSRTKKIWKWFIIAVAILIIAVLFMDILIIKLAPDVKILLRGLRLL